VFAVLFGSPLSGRLARLGYLGGCGLLAILCLATIGVIDILGLLYFGNELEQISTIQLFAGRPHAADIGTLVTSGFFDSAGYTFWQRAGALAGSYFLTAFSVYGIAVNQAGDLKAVVNIMAILLFAPCIYAAFNIAAKRFRDVGLPGWVTVIVIYILSVLADAVAPQLVASAVSLSSSAVLFLAPTGLAKRIFRSGTQTDAEPDDASSAG